MLGADQLGLAVLDLVAVTVPVVDHGRPRRRVAAGQDPAPVVVDRLVQVPITRVATALPAKFVTARASDMNRSMPTIRPTPSTSSGRCEARPPASVASPAPVTPAAPFEAIIMKASREICSPTEAGLRSPWR